MVVVVAAQAYMEGVGVREWSNSNGTNSDRRCSAVWQSGSAHATLSDNSTKARHASAHSWDKATPVFWVRRECRRDSVDISEVPLPPEWNFSD